MTAIGTLIGRGVTGSRPAAGTAGALYYDTTLSILYRDNGASWDNVEGGPDTTNQARVYKSTNTSIANGSVVIITPDTSRYNPGALWVAGVNPSRLTAAVTGIYLISVQLLFAPNGTGTRQAMIKLNGATYIAVQSMNGFVAGDNAYVAISTLYKLTATDYVEMAAYQDSGGALNVLQEGNTSPEFAIQRIG